MTDNKFTSEQSDFDNTGIVRSSGGFDVTRIRLADYTRSLLGEGLRCGLIGEDENARVQLDFLNTLGEMINLYTEGLSSSVSNELAEEFLRSLLYNTDAALLSYRDPVTAFRKLIDTPVYTLYTDGLKVLRRHVCECTGLLVKLKRSKLRLPMKLYNSTIDRTLRNAIKAYEPKFAAHRLKHTLDYPLAVKRSKLRGIYQIRSYIDSLTTENMLCREFDEIEIMRLYKNFCDNDVSGYDESTVNIFSLVFANALIADYLKKDPGTLTLSASDCAAAEKLLGHFEDSEQREILKNTAFRIFSADTAYSLKTLEMIMPGMLNAVKHGKLNNFLVVERNRT